jgi:hypothetical protein
MPGKSGQIDHLSAVHKGPRCRGSPRIFPFPAIAIRTNSEDGSKHSFSQWEAMKAMLQKRQSGGIAQAKPKRFASSSGSSLFGITCSILPHTRYNRCN